jgi:hypothetical protein
VKSLPHFRVRSPSTLFWTNSGSFFQISSFGGYCDEGAVTSEGKRGTTYLAPGRYNALRVRAIGKWTITIRRGVERLGKPITFSGSGQRALPPFRLRSGKTMYWTNTGTVFQTHSTSPKGEGAISSPEHNGRTHLRAGRYRLFVNATEPEQPSGTWTIVIR